MVRWRNGVGFQVICPLKSLRGSEMEVGKHQAAQALQKQGVIKIQEKRWAVWTPRTVEPLWRSREKLGRVDWRV